MPEVNIQKNGLCNYCLDHNKEIKITQKNKADIFLEKMESLFKKIKNKRNSYDALVQVSGGKDSAYLLHLIKNKYKMNVLAFSVINPFVNNLASKNIEKVAKAVGVELIKYFIDETFFKRMIKLSLNSKYISQFGSRHGCLICGELYNLISYNMAVYLKIPLVLSGLDSSQVAMPIVIAGSEKREHIKWRYSFIKGVIRYVFGNRYFNTLYDINVNKLSDNALPAIVYPFTFMPVQRDLVYKILDKYGINKTDINTIATNCDGIPFLDYFSYKSFDCDTYRLHFARDLRRDGYTNFRGSFKKNIKKDQLIKLLDEHKKIIFYFAKKNQSSKMEIEQFCRKFPLHKLIYGKNNCKILLNKMKMIPKYAMYFDIKMP